MNTSNLAALLAERTDASPDAVALRAVERGREQVITYAELTDRAARGAGWLQALGLRAGDHVLVFQPVSVDLYVLLLAIFQTGAAAMFVDPSAGRSHLARCCELVVPSMFVGPWKAQLLRWVSPALRRVARRVVTGGRPWPGAARWEESEQHAPEAGIAMVGADTPALVTFTSGSTGQPKAAVRTHGFLRAQHRVLAETLAHRPGEVDLATLPIFVLANLASGVTSVLPDTDLRRPGRIAVAPVARQLARARPTRTAASPALLERLLDAGEPLDGFRRIDTGGAPVFPALLARLRAAAPAAEIAAVYGSTEAEPMAHLSDRDIDADDLAAMRAGAGLLAGAPVAAVRLRVIADRWGTPLGSLNAAEFGRAVCSRHTAGEIVVAGPHVLQGYLHGAGDAETKFRVDGETWHRTGDAGCLDPRGRLWLLGRCAARVSDAHGVQYPLAVECAARLWLPSIRQCAFVAWRGRRCLLLESVVPLTGEETGRLRAALGWACVEEVRPVRRIPLDRRHEAKVDYVRLSAMLR